MTRSNNSTPFGRMVQRMMSLSMSAAAMTVIGCGTTPDQGTTAKPADASSAPAAEPSYPYSRKEEFTAFMKTKIDQLNQEIDQLSAKIASLGAAAKEEAGQKLKELREQAQRLGQQFDKVQNTSAASWDNAKTDMAKAYDDLQAGIRHARQWLSEKIAP